MKISKKIVVLIVFLFFIVGGAFVFRPHSKINYWAASFCPFCDDKILNYQKFYEDELVLALYTHKPVAPGHCLIIPKRHVERYDGLTSEEMTRVGEVIKKVDQAVRDQFGTSSYLLLQKNGKEAGQSVPHMHFHYVPKKEGDVSRLKFVFQMFIADQQKPIAKEKMHQAVSVMHKAVNNSCLKAEAL